MNRRPPAAGSRRALLLPELPLLVEGEAVVAIVDVEGDPAPWLPALIFADRPRPLLQHQRRVLLLSEGERVEVPVRMQLLDGVEILALPELLRERVDPIVSGLVLLDDRLVLVCDPRRADASALAQSPPSGVEVEAT